MPKVRPPADNAPSVIPRDIEPDWNVPIPQHPIKIAILVVGTYGDLQPFLSIAAILARHGHTIRIGTHMCYRDAVVKAGHDFYPLAGDPTELSEFMVKHKGLLQPWSLIGVAADAPHQTRVARDILRSCWPACCSGGFRAGAIISSPLCWGHIHVAEKLKVPLHIMFPQPWLPTELFPHPVSGWRVEGPSKTNVLSYKLYEFGMWTAIRDHANHFRKKLGLPPVLWAEGIQGLLRTRKVPHSFLWSEDVVPRPHDYPDFADVVGFVNIPDQPDYKPDRALADFLAAGDPPILVTFGSMRIQRPMVVGHRILYAARDANVRVVVQNGWSDLSTGVKPDPLICHIGPAPHAWLMPRCCAVVHHGGAGTTYASLKAGKPSLVCPFFGDQPFWGAALHKLGAGLTPVDIDYLDSQELTQAFLALKHNKHMVKAAKRVSAKLRKEDGAVNAVQSFYKHFPKWDHDRLKLQRQSSLAKLRQNTEACAPPSRGLGQDRSSTANSIQRSSPDRSPPGTAPRKLHTGCSHTSHTSHIAKPATRDSQVSALERIATASTCGEDFGLLPSVNSSVADPEEAGTWASSSSEAEAEEEEAQVSRRESTRLPRLVAKPGPPAPSKQSRRRPKDDSCPSLSKSKSKGAPGDTLAAQAAMRGWQSDACLRGALRSADSASPRRSASDPASFRARAREFALER